MNILKRILNYVFWTIIALILGICYMRIILGASPEYATNYKIISYLLYEYAFFFIGAIIGYIIALLFILIDIFYLNKKLKSKANATIVRALIIVAISVIVGATHYLLEKVIDVI